MLGAFSAEPVPASSPNKPEEKKTDKVKRNYSFKPGTIVRDLKLPRYENARLVSFITLNYVEVLTEENMFGRDIVARMFKPEAETILIMKTGNYDMDRGIVKSEEETRVLDPRFTARSIRAVGDTAKNQIFMSGPVIMTFDREEARARRVQAGSPTATDKK